jgi:REP element-mobilizing transposase RayT
MAVRNKYFVPNEIYFLTFTILGWRNVFVNDKYCGLVYKWFDYVKNQYGNKIYGYVIMPNHIHCIMKITDKSRKPPILIANAKRFLAYQIIEFLEQDNNLELLKFFADSARVEDGAKHKVFEDGYDLLLIGTEEFFREKINYIHNNPGAKHWRLADRPEKYKYSSAANYHLGKGFYDVDLMKLWL